MVRKFVDTTVYKTIEERLAAATRMIELAFQQRHFVQEKVDRKIFSARKHNL